MDRASKGLSYKGAYPGSYPVQPDISDQQWVCTSVSQLLSLDPVVIKPTSSITNQPVIIIFITTLILITVRH